MKHIKDFLTLVVGSIRFKVFVMKADMMHKTTGKRYFVIPYPNSDFKLLVLCNDDIKRLKRARILRKEVSHITIMDMCLYFTCASARNTERMDKETRKKKEKQWKKHIKYKLKK